MENKNKNNGKDKDMYRKIIIGMLLACLVIGGTGTIVFAQSKDPIRCEMLPKISDVLGMSPQEIWTEIQAGKSLQDLFTQKDLNYSDFQTQWAEAKNECIDQALADNKITAAQAERLKANLQENLANGRFFNYGFFAKGERFTMLNTLFARGEKGLSERLLDALGMTPSEIKTALQSGKTLQDLVTEKGINADELYHTWLNDEIAAVNSKLEAGRISQRQAETLINKLQQQLEQPFPWARLREFQQMKRNHSQNGDLGGFHGQKHQQNPSLQQSNEF